MEGAAAEAPGLAEPECQLATFDPLSVLTRAMLDCSQCGRVSRSATLASGQIFPVGPSPAGPSRRPQPLSGTDHVIDEGHGCLLRVGKRRVKVEE